MVSFMIGIAVLTAAIGQQAGRLRLHRLHVAGDPLMARTRLTV
jgi:hypothetical protein